MNNKTKDIKKVIKHRQEYVFHKSIEEAKKQGYEPTHKPFLNRCGTWMQEMKKTVKWDNPNPSDKKIKWGDMI